MRRPKEDHWQKVVTMQEEASSTERASLRVRDSQGFGRWPSDRSRQCPGLFLQAHCPQSQRLLRGVGNHCSSRLFRHSVPSLPASVLCLELCEAEDNLGLISVPGRHVTCVAGTQTARVLAANSSGERLRNCLT